MSESDFGVRRGPTKLRFPSSYSNGPSSSSAANRPAGVAYAPPPPIVHNFGSAASPANGFGDFESPSPRNQPPPPSSAQMNSPPRLSSSFQFPPAAESRGSPLRPAAFPRSNSSFFPTTDVEDLQRSIAMELEAPSFGSRRRLSGDPWDQSVNSNWNQSFGIQRGPPAIRVQKLTEMIPEPLRRPDDHPQALEMRVSAGVLEPPREITKGRQVFADPFGRIHSTGQSYVRDTEPLTPEVDRPVYRRPPPTLLPSFAEMEEDSLRGVVSRQNNSNPEQRHVGATAPTLEERRRRRAAMASLAVASMGPSSSSTKGPTVSAGIADVVPSDLLSERPPLPLLVGETRGEYVPFAIRPLGHDDIRWIPPDLEAEQRKKLDAAFPVPTVVAVETPVAPPMSIRNVVETYRTKRKIVAYDESEAFAFCAKPIHCSELIDKLREETRRAQAEGRLSAKASVVTIRHGTSIYIIGGDRRHMVSFNPALSVEGMPSSGWNWVDLQDGPCGGAYEDHGAETLRRGEVHEVGFDPYNNEPILQTVQVALSIPPAHAPMVPIPNVPFAVAVTRSRVYLLSLDDGVWFSARLDTQLATYQRIGWVHLIDECTLYVRNKACTMHGMINLRPFLLDVTVFRRNTHDDFVPPLLQQHNGQVCVDTVQFRLPPTSEKLVAIDSVPGVAVQVVKSSETAEGRRLSPHVWIYVFHPTAKSFVPWKRMDDLPILLYVAMPNHLNVNATTVLFFTEEMRRVDTGAKLGPGGEQLERYEEAQRRAKMTASHTSATSLDWGQETVPVDQRAQNVIRVAYRLEIPNPMEDDAIPEDASKKQHPSSANTPARGGGGGSAGSYPTQKPTISDPSNAKRERSMLFRCLRGLRPLGPRLTSSSSATVPTGDNPAGRRGAASNHPTSPQGNINNNTSSSSSNGEATSSSSGGNDFVSSLILTVASDAPNDVDAIVRAKRDELHAVVSMFDRCAAFLAYDCKTYVVVELDRLLWLRRTLSSAGQ